MHAFSHRFRRWIGLVAMFGLTAFAIPTTVAAGDRAISSLLEPGHVLLLRHANAPGVGDPPNIVIGDCATQRNLDERGRAQAKSLGERLRSAGITRARVYTSQWCRCRDTAALLGVGVPEDLPALNSFFGAPEARSARIEALRAFLAKLPRAGGPVVLVTHQLTITALTGTFPASGEGLVLKLRDDGTFETLCAFESGES